MKIYLAGGMKSDWQDKVMEANPNNTYFDPRSHNHDIPEDYTKWDLDHVAMADMIFACFTNDNPSGFGMCIEIGYAHSMGIPVILVDEKQLKSWDIVRCCCEYCTESITSGIKYLGSKSLQD